MQEVKLIVAGGRDFNDYPLLCQAIQELAETIYKEDAVSIVSGMAKGADSLGVRFARENGVLLHSFPADWNQHGKSAGFIRNKQMGNAADALLAFWDGESRGTAQMIEYMNSLHKPVFTIRYGASPSLVPVPSLEKEVTWSRNGGYQCSSKGDSRFSALFARMPDGRTIEQHYQCDVKGYQPGGTNWRLGKGKPPLNPEKDLWSEYLALWKTWANHNPQLISQLASKAKEFDYVLSDTFATTPVNQARALAEILNTQ